MAFFIRTLQGVHLSKPRQIWKIDDDVAVRLDVANPEGGPGTFFKAEPGEGIWDAIRRQATAWFEPDGDNPFVETKLSPGEFYPRMARPSAHHPTAQGWNPELGPRAVPVAIARGQLAVLTRQLARICQTIHPTEVTFNTFGHDIRNLLILACTEVESHWRAVLVANGIAEERPKTTDYVKLSPAMKLDEYGVTFPTFPWLDYFSPFKGWDAERATGSLPWYDAYNAVKHDRETKFEQATLRRVFEAVAAIVIMMDAQFGWAAELEKTPELGGFVHLALRPFWPSSELYMIPVGTPTGQFSPVFYKFG